MSTFRFSAFPLSRMVSGKVIGFFQVSQLNALRFPTQCSEAPKAMLPDSKLNALRLPKQCFETPNSMLLASKSNTLRRQKQCYEKKMVFLFAVKTIYTIFAKMFD